MHKLSDIVTDLRPLPFPGWSGRVFSARLVKRAFRLKANARVAVKLYHPQLFMDQDKHIKQRIKRELEWGKKNVSHRVVRSYDLVEAEYQRVRTFALIMEFVNGNQLSKHVESEFPLSANELLRITEDLIQALNALHSSGLIHRDVKPENVMVEHSGHAKLMDLGVIKVPRPREGERLTKSTEFLGTIRYADREYLFRGRDDELADAWSLGLTVFHMLYGRPPYAGKKRPAEFVVAINKGNIDFPKTENRFGTSPTSDHLFIESVMKALLRPRQSRLTPLNFVVSTMNDKKRAEFAYYIEHLEDLAASALADMASGEPVFLPWVLYQVRKNLGLRALEQIATFAFSRASKWALWHLNDSGVIEKAVRKLLHGRSLPYADEFKRLPKGDKMRLAPQLADYLKRCRRNKEFKSQVGIDPRLYLEHLASEDGDAEVRQDLNKLADTFRPKSSSYY